MMLSTYLLLLLLLLAGLASSAPLKAPKNGGCMDSLLRGNPKPWAISPEGAEIWGSDNKIDDNEMQGAIQCLQDHICSQRNVPFQGKIRCTIGTSVAYMCNYRPNNLGGFRETLEKFAGIDPGSQSCDQAEMYEAWRQIRVAKDSQTGWWYDKAGFRTYGFDRSCPNGECDNGWKKGSEGEQCTNIANKPLPWTFDYRNGTYQNYSGTYGQVLPVVGGESNNPEYFRPWIEGRRPT